jgi:hypothetical protein
MFPRTHGPTKDLRGNLLPMRASCWVVVLVVPLGVVSCGPTNQQNYTHAAIATPAAIGMVGLHRAITKDCWARCSPGYLCNEENGLCEAGECLPGCEVGFHCVRDIKRGTYCVRDGDGAAVQSTLNVSSAPDAGLVVDGGAADAEPADASLP